MDSDLQVDGQRQDRAWVVGVDGSDGSRAALRWAADHAAGRGAQLRVVTVIGAVSPSVESEWGFVAPEEPGLVELAEGRIRAEVAEVVGDSVPTEVMTRRGAPAPELVEAGRDAELVVVGGRGLGRIRGALIGSVSLHCATRSGTPTVVVPPTFASPARRIAVGHDGSPNSAAAVSWALDFAGTDAAVEIVHALPLAPWLPASVVRERHGDVVAAAEQDFLSAVRDLDPDGRATTTFTLADPRLALAEAAGRADLVVVGARGSGLVSATLLGSVSTYLLHHANRPTAVIPHT